MIVEIYVCIFCFTCRLILLTALNSATQRRIFYGGTQRRPLLSRAGKRGIYIKR